MASARGRCSCKGSIRFHNDGTVPMSTGDTNDPQHWRDRAAQMRALALTMGDTEAAILMRDLAADYDKLAERAAIRANGKKPRSNGKLR